MVVLNAADNLMLGGTQVLAATKGSAKVWPYSPANLFGGGKEGCWYDPADLSTLWQDGTGTVPVTTDGDPVARIDDLSGNGNHLIGSTTYRTDGSRHWLEGGVELSGGVGTLKADWSFRIATRINDYTGTLSVLRGVGSNFLTLRPNVSANRLRMTTRLASAGVVPTTGDNTSVAIGSGTDSYVRFTVSPGQQSLQQNAFAPLVQATSWTTQVGASNAIFAINASGLRWYGGVFLGRQLTTDEEAQLAQFMEARRDGGSP